jgi:two-component system nitrate/nitrite response regulator NarL
MSVPVPEPGPQIRVLVVSPMRIYQQGLSYVLAQEPAIRVVGMASSLQAAGLLPGGEGRSGGGPADVLLFDLAVNGGLAELRRLANASGPKILVLGVAEDEEQIIACAEAGIAGYVTPNGSVAELVQTIHDAAHGEFNCPPHIAASLLRRVATAGARPAAAGSPHAAATRGRPADRPGPVEQGDRQAAQHRARHGQEPRPQHP